MIVSKLDQNFPHFLNLIASMSFLYSNHDDDFDKVLFKEGKTLMRRHTGFDISIGIRKFIHFEYDFKFQKNEL